MMMFCLEIGEESPSRFEPHPCLGIVLESDSMHWLEIGLNDQGESSIPWLEIELDSGSPPHLGIFSFLFGQTHYNKIEFL